MRDYNEQAEDEIVSQYNKEAQAEAYVDKNVEALIELFNEQNPEAFEEYNEEVLKPLKLTVGNHLGYQECKCYLEWIDSKPAYESKFNEMVSEALGNL